jgi:hypothetical protein
VDPGFNFKIHGTLGLYLFSTGVFLQCMHQIFSLPKCFFSKKDKNFFFFTKFFNKNLLLFNSKKKKFL